MGPYVQGTWEDAAKRAKDASAILFGEMDIREADAELLDTLSAEIPFARSRLDNWRPNYRSSCALRRMR